MCRVVQHDTAAAFLDRAESWLLESEADHNILLSVGYLLNRGAKPFVEAAYCATVEARGRVVGAAMLPPPDGVYLTQMPASAVSMVAEQIRAFNANAPEVIGPVDVTIAFATNYVGDGWSLHSRLRQYTLETVVPPAKPAAGGLRLANDTDVALLDRWAVDYGREVGSKVDVREFFRTMVERRSLFLWDDPDPRCAVTASGLTPNGARISTTYTPPQFRGNGYARSAVAGVSQRLLDGGKRFCVIVADINDATPNAIYKQIGFKPKSEFALIHLQ